MRYKEGVCTCTGVRAPHAWCTDNHTLVCVIDRIDRFEVNQPNSSWYRRAAFLHLLRYITLWLWKNTPHAARAGPLSPHPTAPVHVCYESEWMRLPYSQERIAVGALLSELRRCTFGAVVVLDRFSVHSPVLKRSMVKLMSQFWVNSWRAAWVTSWIDTSLRDTVGVMRWFESRQLRRVLKKRSMQFSESPKRSTKLSESPKRSKKFSESPKKVNEINSLFESLGHNLIPINIPDSFFESWVNLNQNFGFFEGVKPSRLSYLHYQHPPKTFRMLRKVRRQKWQESGLNTCSKLLLFSFRQINLPYANTDQDHNQNHSRQRQQTYLNKDTTYTYSLPNV